MKRNFHFYIVAVLLSISIGVFAQENINDAIIKLSAKKFEWLKDKQIDSLQRMLDDDVLYIHSNGLIETKYDIIENILSGKLVYKNVEVEDAKVRLEGDLAVLNADGIFTGAINGNEFTARLRYTEVYVRKKNQWKLFSRHASKL